jgi:hypothetical protein
LHRRSSNDSTTQRAHKERTALAQHQAKVELLLCEHRNSEAKAQGEEVELEGACLDCQAEASFFFSTILEEVARLRDKELSRLAARKD